MEPTHRPPTPSDHPAATPNAIAHAQGKVLSPTPELAEAIRRGYEPKDINLRGLFIFLGTLVVTLVIVLAAIYGIMMAMVDYGRQHDALGSPVAIGHVEQYAPLQPSVAHPALDTDDMALMREQNNEVLNHPKLARQMPIADAINITLAKLVTKPAVAPATQPVYPPGSGEGHYGPEREIKAD